MHCNVYRISPICKTKLKLFVYFGICILLKVGIDTGGWYNFLLAHPLFGLLGTVLHQLLRSCFH